MTKEENRPAGCVLRLFGTPEQTVQKAVAALPDTWQGTVHCRTRGAETLVALQSSTPQQLRRAVQLLRTSFAPALYGEGEQTLAAAAVQALEQHRKLLVCSDAAAGALLETRLENLPGAEKVFDFGAMSYANAALNARLSRKLRKAPQAEPAEKHLEHGNLRVDIERHSVTKAAADRCRAGSGLCGTAPQSAVAGGRQKGLLAAVRIAGREPRAVAAGSAAPRCLRSAAGRGHKLAALR